MNGIWIRSQDKKTLAEPNLLNYEEECRDSDGNRFENAIITDASETEYLLGTYATEERALQVLDEIQAFINCDGEMNGNKYRAYEMPQA
jgi:hypothetical protein